MKVKIYKGFWFREGATRSPNSMYLYGENCDYTSGTSPIDTTNSSDRIKALFTGKNYPMTTQAVVRGLDNAFPIITKKGHKTDEFFDDTDDDVNKYVELIERDVKEIKEYSKDFDTLLIPEGGFALGKSRLPLRQALTLSLRLNLLLKDIDENSPIKFKVIESPYTPLRSKNFQCKTWYGVKPYKTT